MFDVELELFAACPPPPNCMLTSEPIDTPAPPPIVCRPGDAEPEPEGWLLAVAVGFAAALVELADAVGFAAALELEDPPPML